MDQPHTEVSKKRYLLLPIFITICLDFISLGIVLPILTPLLLNPQNSVLPHDFSQSQRTILLGILIASFSIASFFGAPVLGSLSDRIGRKKVLRISLATSFFCFLLFGIGILTSNIWLLFLGRILGGFAGANVNTCVAAMVDITEPKDRVKNFGLIGFASFACGYIVGPTIGGFYSNPAILPWFNNETPFWFCAVWTLMNLALIEVSFKETLTQRKNQKPNLSEEILGFLKVFKYPINLKTAFLVGFLVTFGFNFFDQFFQIFLVQKFQFNQFQIANILAFLGIWMALSQGLLVRIVPKKTNPVLVLMICLPAVAILIPSIIFPSNPTGLYFILPLIALFQGLAWPFSSALLSDLTDQSKQGEVLGINTSLIGLAIGLPPLLSGFLAVVNINIPILIGGFCSAVAFFALISQFKIIKMGALLSKIH